MNPKMPRVIDRVFARLQGVHGTSFTSKFSTGLDRNGIDQGFENAKAVWADELSGFADNLGAIAYALDNIDDKYVPSCREFLALCRTAPKKEVPVLQHKPTAEEMAHAKELAHKVAAAVKPKEFDGLLWAKKPKSQVACSFVFDGYKHPSRFPQLAAVYAEHIKNGIADEFGKLLARWDGVQWVKP